MRKKCSSDQEKLLKFEAEGREFSKIKIFEIFENSRPLASNFKSISRSLEQFIQTVKGHNNFW